MDWRGARHRNDSVGCRFDYRRLQEEAERFGVTNLELEGSVLL